MEENASSGTANNWPMSGPLKMPKLKHIGSFADFLPSSGYSSPNDITIGELTLRQISCARRGTRWCCCSLLEWECICVYIFRLIFVHLCAVQHMHARPCRPICTSFAPSRSVVLLLLPCFVSFPACWHHLCAYEPKSMLRNFQRWQRTGRIESRAHRGTCAPNTRTHPYTYEAAVERRCSRK